jgi:hypothetical protein
MRCGTYKGRSSPGCLFGARPRDSIIVNWLSRFDLRQPAARSGSVTQNASLPVVGFDLTFSAPKSVSVAWAVAEEATQEHVYRRGGRGGVRPLGFPRGGAAAGHTRVGDELGPEQRRGMADAGLPGPVAFHGGPVGDVQRRPVGVRDLPRAAAVGSGGPASAPPGNPANLDREARPSARRPRRRVARPSPRGGGTGPRLVGGNLAGRNDLPCCEPGTLPTRCWPTPRRVAVHTWRRRATFGRSNVLVAVPRQFHGVRFGTADDRMTPALAGRQALVYEWGKPATRVAVHGSECQRWVKTDPLAPCGFDGTLGSQFTRQRQRNLPSLIRGWVRPYGVVFPLGAIQRPAGLGIQEVGVIRNSPAPVSLLGRGYDWGLDRARGQPQASHVVGDLAHVRHPDVAVLHRPGDEPVEHCGA